MEQRNDFSSIFSRPKKGINYRGVLPSDIKNPWPGLSPYKDPLVSIVKRKFCGRDKETFELTRMIDDNIFVTLYGKSGNGKTSLLNAGVFPQLRKMQYVPLNIRLGMDAVGQTFQQCIIQRIEKLFTDERMEEVWVVPPLVDRTAVEYLWNFFARHRFYADSRHKTVVYPVIVLDQFEEVYRANTKEADILLNQINYLIDESHELEDCELDDGTVYSYEYNYRFVVSIREDDLYWLEDSIDNNMLYAMKQTRYRLRSLSTQGARDVILIPGEGMFAEEEKNDIVKTITAIAKGEGSDISSNVLSLICSRIYLNYLLGDGSGRISYEQVKEFASGNPLEKFYLEATAHLTNSERAYLEDNLVDVSGRRSFVPQANYEKILKKKGGTLLSGPQRILQQNNERIELIHDSFCKVLLDQKSQREVRWRTLVEHLGLMAMCLLLCYKMALYHPFGMSVESDGLLGVLFSWLFGSIPLVSVVFMVMTVGVIRKSFPTVFTWIAVILLLAPPLVQALGTSHSIQLPFMHHVISLILLAFVIVAHVYNLRNRPSKPQERMSFSNFLDLRSLRLWTLVYICFVVYYYVYVAPSGWYVSSAAFINYLFFIPTLFYSVWEKEGNDSWVIILLLLMPISVLVYTTSDTELFTLSLELNTYGSLVVLWLLGFPFYILWTISDDFKKTSNRFLLIIIFLAIVLSLYLLFYQHKMLLLAVWCLLGYGMVYFFMKDENKHEALLCIATFLLTLGVYTFTKGYNPFIKNVSIAEQKGNWHWNTVMAKSDTDWRLYDGLTGDDMLGIGFDYQDQDLNLVKKLDHRIVMNYDFVNPLYEISSNDSTITYKSRPLFEQRISRDAGKLKLAATIIRQQRRWMFNDFINPAAHRPVDHTRQTILQLMSQEVEKLEQTLDTSNDSIIKHSVSQQLCQTLSSSWLYHATDSIGVIGDMWYFNYLCSLNNFMECHYYEEMYQEKNSDWDGTFEYIAKKYIECLDYIRIQASNRFLENTLPKLIDVYDKTSDYGLKTLLYGKIIRIQQIAILHRLGNEEWAHTTIEPPIGVDINQFYLQHLP